MAAMGSSVVMQVPALALTCYSLLLGALTHIWLLKRKTKNVKGPCDPTGDFFSILLFCFVCASDFRTGGISPLIFPQRASFVLSDRGHFCWGSRPIPVLARGTLASVPP